MHSSPLAAAPLLATVLLLAGPSAVAQERVTDINASGDAAPGWLAIVDEVLYFRADDGIFGEEVWRYDADIDMTVRLTDINMAGDSEPAFLTAYDGDLYFEAELPGIGDRLYRYDPDTGAVAVVHPGDAEELVVLGEVLYFGSEDAEHGYELWRYDAATGSAERLTDINEGPAGSGVREMAGYQGKLYFSADDGLGPGSNGLNAELWRYDPATGVVEQVADISRGGNAFPESLTVLGDKLYFEANDGGFSDKLWRYDAATDVTESISSFGTGPAAIESLSYMTVYNGQLYMQAEGRPSTFAQRVGWELYRFDPADDSAHLVADINPGDASSDSFPARLTEYNGVLYFYADDGTHGVELWSHDGATGATVMVADINPGAGSSYTASSFVSRFGAPVVLDGEFYFRADDGSTGSELWRLGTAVRDPDRVFRSGFEPVAAAAAASGPPENQGF